MTNLKQQKLWWAALIAGATYLLPVLMGWQGYEIIVWKGLGVGLLALWALASAPGRDGKIIAAVLALGALGDVLLEAVGLETAALAFAAGHVVAIPLYLRYRREVMTPSQKALCLLLIPSSLLIVWALLYPQAGWWHAALYTALVSAMAASAWVSRFSRLRTGIGAMLFLASDLLIFANTGRLNAGTWSHLLIWPLYFAGQALIARGVVTTLQREAESG